LIQYSVTNLKVVTGTIRYVALCASVSALPVGPSKLSLETRAGAGVGDGSKGGLALLRAGIDLGLIAPLVSE
jgi:hypothetical protein